MPDDRSPQAPGFTQAQLENSVPFDVYRTLLGDEGYGLSDAVLVIITENERRVRARKPADQAKLENTIDAFLANLAVVAINRQDATRFVALTFNNNRHAKTRVTANQLKLVRRAMLDHGLIEGQIGFRRTDPMMEEFTFSRVSRYRPTAKLVAMFDFWGIGHKSVGFHADRPLWRLNAPIKGAGPPPPDVIASEVVLAKNNALLADADILLPAEAWERISLKARRKLTPVADDAADIEGEDADEPTEAKWYAGDETAKRLYRAFKGDWDRGGRIYGGWWMQLPKAERGSLTINGEPVVELDFAQLHPTLLYARAGVRLDADPYLPPEYEGERERVRELGKVTFNRFINTVSPARDGLVLSERKQDRPMFPSGVSFDEYQSRLRLHLATIAFMFGSGVGVRLQREDSDLAIAILDQLSTEGIAALPIHDSFIVQRRHEEALRNAMTSAFKKATKANPLIK